ncbi:MAG: hypothetical protein M1819_005445 [Sarea resinae]|nr:MAG: hypothetical protein M1819_005445 [Sarea resinae]
MPCNTSDGKKRPNPDPNPTQPHPAKRSKSLVKEEVVIFDETSKGRPGPPTNPFTTPIPRNWHSFNMIERMTYTLQMGSPAKAATLPMTWSRCVATLIDKGLFTKEELKTWGGLPALRARYEKVRQSLQEFFGADDEPSDFGGFKFLQAEGLGVYEVGDEGSAPSSGKAFDPTDMKDTEVSGGLSPGFPGQEDMEYRGRALEAKKSCSLALASNDDHQKIDEGIFFFAIDYLVNAGDSVTLREQHKNRFSSDGTTNQGDANSDSSIRVEMHQKSFSISSLEDKNFACAHPQRQAAITRVGNRRRESPISVVGIPGIDMDIDNPDIRRNRVLAKGPPFEIYEDEVPGHVYDPLRPQFFGYDMPKENIPEEDLSDGRLDHAEINHRPHGLIVRHRGHVLIARSAFPRRARRPYNGNHLSTHEPLETGLPSEIPPDEIPSHGAGEGQTRLRRAGSSTRPASSGVADLDVSGEGTQNETHCADDSEAAGDATDN